MRRGVVPLVVLIIGIITTIFVALGLTQNQASPSPTLPPSPAASAGQATPTPTPKSSPLVKPSLVASPSPAVKAVSGPPGAGLSTITVATEKGNFKATVLSVDLSSTRMITDTGNDSDCGNGCVTMQLADYIKRNGGFAGVNGSYFCPAAYPECALKTDSFDFSIYNTRLGKWINGGNLGWGDRRSALYIDGSGAHYTQSPTSIGGPSAAVVNYPGLVESGNVQIDDNQSGLSDKQKSVSTKVGIGTRNASNVMVVIGYGMNMQQFAHVFKSLGATGALNLDDGGSTALYYQGRYVTGPGRNLPNAVVFAPK